MTACKNCVLLPLDGSRSGLTALSTAIRLSSALEGNLHIVHVSPEALTRDELLYRIGLPASGIAGAIVDGMIGDPVEIIVERAEKPDIGYVVLSTHGGGDAASFLMGGIAEGVMTRTNASVVLVPPRASEPDELSRSLAEMTATGFRNILVPVDGSPSSARAVPKALEIAAGSGATVWLLHIPVATFVNGDLLEPGSFAFENMVDQPHEFSRLREEFIERFAKRAPEYTEDIDVRLEVTLGYPPQEIDRLTRELHIDLVVTAWHGQLEPGRAQVLKSLLHYSTVPVMAVKCTAAESGSHLRLAGVAGVAA